MAEVGGLASYLRWSPDGKRIRFTSLAWETYQNTIWEVSAEGGTVRPLFPDWSAEQWGGRWTPDGNYYVFNSESNIWAACEKPVWFRKAALKPIRLTFGPLDYYAPLPAADGRRIFAVGRAGAAKCSVMIRSDRNSFPRSPVYRPTESTTRATASGLHT